MTISPDTGANLSTPLEPHVQPAYYGALIVNEVIGNTGCSTLSELSIDDATLAGYAAYEEGNLARVVLLDSDVYLTNQTGVRSSKAVTIDIGDCANRVEVKRLYMA